MHFMSSIKNTLAIRKKSNGKKFNINILKRNNIFNNKLLTVRVYSNYIHKEIFYNNVRQLQYI